MTLHLGGDALALLEKQRALSNSNEKETSSKEPVEMSWALPLSGHRGTLIRHSLWLSQQKRKETRHGWLSNSRKSVLSCDDVPLSYGDYLLVKLFTSSFYSVERAF